MMNPTLPFISIFVLLIAASNSVYAQYEYESSEEYPFGRFNPDAPEELLDFDPLIGLSKCSSDLRNPDGSWAETKSMTWKWKYIMNGYGVQDETLSESGIFSGSIRQFNADSSAWYVHYYSSGSVPSTLPSWEGGKKQDGSIILYKKQTAPNGMEGFYKINFLNIEKDSFEWRGEWVNLDETIVYPTWKISCKKVED